MTSFTRWLITTAAGLLLILAPICVNAQQVLDETREQRAERHKETIAASKTHLDELRSNIEGLANGGNPTAYYLALTDYLKTAMLMVYEGKIAADEESSFGADLQTSNSDLTSLVALGYLPAWPANPLNGWQPLQVLSADQPFSACDLVFDLCPPGEASAIGTDLVRASFQLFIYASEPDSKYLGVDVCEGNENWSSPPRGAIFGSGMHMETVAEREERVARIKKWIEDHPEDAAAAGADPDKQ